MNGAPQPAAPSPPLLTTRELASLLRIKERKVYDLVAAGEIPCVRVTGKLLFPRADIDAWLGRHRLAGALRPALPPALVVGSHDPLLDWALRESGSGLAMLLDGSLDGLARLARGEAQAAGVHLPGADTESWNVAQIEAALPEQPVVALEWAWRVQGLILPAGNSRAVRGLADLPGLRLLPRQPASGSFVLLRQLLREAGIAWEALTLAEPPARSEADLALAIASGEADCGLGLAALARQFQLDFLPLARERYDLVIWRRAVFEPPLQRLFAFCRSARFLARARELAGYDASGLGSVRYNGP